MKYLYAIVKFPNNSKEYVFLTDLKLEEGDSVVVDTRHGLTVAKFVDYTSEPFTSIGLKWIVQKIDLKAHENRLRFEAELKEIEMEMEKRRNEIGELQVWRMIAREDEIMSKILKKYVDKIINF